MVNPSEIIDSASKAIDNNLESSEERQATLTQRLEIDSTSPYMLPQLIRPIVTLVCLLMQMLLFVAAFLHIEVPVELYIEVGALNMSTIGFYFNSRRNEKINAKKMAAAIKIERIKAKESSRLLRRKKPLKDN